MSVRKKKESVSKAKATTPVSGKPIGKCKQRESSELNFDDLKEKTGVKILSIARYDATIVAA